MAKVLNFSSTLNLANADIDIRSEVEANPAPTAIIRIADRSLVFGNRAFFQTNGLDPVAILGKSLAALCDEEDWLQAINELNRSGKITDYSFCGYQFRIADGILLRDRVRFVEDVKKIEYLGCDCYVFSEKQIEVIQAAQLQVV